MSVISQMVDIKTRFNALKVPKTKAAKEKYWDKCCALRREMFDLVEANQQEVSQLVVKHAHSLCVMAPVGGPWGMTPETTVKLHDCKGTYFELILDNQWVGLVNLMTDSCGMDNVLILAKLEKVV